MLNGWEIRLGVGSSCHTQTNVNVCRGIVWCISIHTLHEKEVLFSLVCTSRRIFNFVK